MNCEKFDKIILEFADYKPMEVAVRDAGLSHIAVCGSCATKLANARAVNNGLVLAAGLDHEEAPPRVKANLLAAFAQLQHPQTESAQVVNVSRDRRFRWWVASGAAAAVAAAILLVVILPNWKETSGPGPQVASSGLPPVVAKPPPVPTVLEDKVATASVDQSLPVGKKSQPARRRRSNSFARTRYETVARIDNEYLPLTYMAKETAMDSGMIVRVELSRSALASLGLPITIDGNTSSSVKAEVIIGDDGVARAIRLLQ